MQNRYLKILGLVVTLTFALCHPALPQVSSHTLETADSLFQLKQYTQSLELYEKILAHKAYTPAMLLKMAYIQEGLNNIGRAMYYLNLYSQVSKDKAVTEKMSELARKYNLEGYTSTDKDEFLTFYYDHRPGISLALAALAVLLLSLAFHIRLRRNRRPLGSIIVLGVVLLVLLFHTHAGERVGVGVIMNANTYLMSGPSAGANVVDIVTDGHRVEVIGRRDVWLKIRWSGDIAYVKENNVMPIWL